MKKISAIIICLLMFITCGLAGCASFYEDPNKYYSDVLATVGNTNITRFDVIQAYNSYGYSYYVSQLGKSEQDAINETLDLLIERESLYLYAKDHEELYKPTAYQMNEMINTMFDSFDSTINSYISTAKSLLNIETSDSTTETDSSESKKIEDYLYTKRAEIKHKTVDGKVEYYISYNTEKEPTEYEKVLEDKYLNLTTNEDIVKAIKDKYMEHLDNKLQNEYKQDATNIKNKAIALFTKDLLNGEKYLNENSTDNESLIYRYVKRNYESQLKSLYLTNVQEYYLENEQLSINELTERFKTMIEVGYISYNSDSSSYKSAMKGIGTKGDTIIYHPTLEDGTQFGYFIHTLISFSDIQKTKIEAYNSLLETEKDQTVYNSIIAETTAHPRDAETGIVDETITVSLQDIISEYNNIKSIPNYDEKLAKFIEFMFKYTGDSSTLSSGMPYVIGSYNEANGETYSTNSSMVKEFTDEAISLMKDNNIGNMSNIDLSDTASMCISTYGIHLLFYVNNVNAYDIPYSERSSVYFKDDTSLSDDLYNLYYKTINPLTNETYFDMLFDLVYPSSSDSIYTSNTAYSKQEQAYIKTSQAKHKVVKYTTKIKATKIS